MLKVYHRRRGAVVPALSLQSFTRTITLQVRLYAFAPVREKARGRGRAWTEKVPASDTRPGLVRATELLHLIAFNLFEANEEKYGRC